MVAEGSRSHTSATTLIPCPLCSIRCWVGHICGLLGIFVYAASPKHPSVCLTFAAIPVVGIKKRKHLPATIMVASGVFSFFCPFGGEASISTELIVVTYVSSNSSVACHSHRQKVRNAGLNPVICSPSAMPGCRSRDGGLRLHTTPPSIPTSRQSQLPLWPHPAVGLSPRR